MGATVGTRGQQEASLTQPPLIETNTLSIKLPNHQIINSEYFLDTTVSFLQKYHTEPLVYLSLLTLDALFPLSQSILTHTLTSIS